MMEIAVIFLERVIERDHLQSSDPLQHSLTQSLPPRLHIAGRLTQLGIIIKREISSGTVMMMKLTQVPSQRTRYICLKKNTVIRKERQVETETKEENHHERLVINLQELLPCLNDQKEKSGNQKG